MGFVGFRDDMSAVVGCGYVHDASQHEDSMDGGDRNRILLEI